MFKKYKGGRKTSMKKEDKKNWEEEFNEIFGFLKQENPQLKEAFEDFIRKTLEKEKERWKEEDRKKEEEGRNRLAQYFFGKPFNELSAGEKSAIIVLIDNFKREEERSEQKG